MANAVFKDRQHQAELRERISRVDTTDFPLKILAWVVPGGGKSRLPGILAQRFRHHKIAWFVPRLSLKRQAVRGMMEDFGIKLRDSGNDTDPARDSGGFVTTHEALVTNPDLWRHELQRRPYIVIVDEIHHAKVDRDENLRPLSQALSRLRADVWLNMTGTLDTNDGTMIWGMEYDTIENGWRINPEQSADIYIRYARPTALSEGAICPIEFHHHDGPIRWKPGAAPEKEYRMSEVDRKDEGAAIFTALRTEVATQLFNSGLNHWQRHSRGKLILVADRQENVRKYDRLLKNAGLRTALAIDDNPVAQLEIDNFCNDPGVHALATCQMAYEGLDAPSTTHIICLTHIRSAPWIEQMLARAWRSGKSQCWAFVPDDPRMNRVIEKIASEQPAILRDGNGGGGDGGGPIPDSVLALGGMVDEVERRFLDGEFGVDETEERIVVFLREFGLTGAEPEVVALLNRLRRPPIPTAVMPTLAQQETSLRKQIADDAREIDRLIAVRTGRQPQWGETQGRLIRLTNKSIKDMNVEELKRAYATLQSLRP